jgi:hypothetical protein
MHLRRKTYDPKMVLWATGYTGDTKGNIEGIIEGRN